MREALAMTHLTPIDNDGLVARPMENIDPRLVTFIRTKVNSFIKWDLVRFFHDNPQRSETIESIGRYTGRIPSRIEPEIRQLVNTGILQAIPNDEDSDQSTYQLVADAETRKLIDSFIAACDDRQFRVKAIYYVIRSMY